MMMRSFLLACGAALAAAMTLAGGAAAEEAGKKLKLLIIDGQNNHNFLAMTPHMKKKLEATGRFTVEVARTPGKNGKAEDWAKFRPAFKDYDVVLSNYNGQRWPKEVEAAFVDYVKNGGGVVIVHAANNAFPGWDEYDEMIGLGWRNNQYGERIYLDDEGKAVRQEKGKGPGAGHGAQHAFVVTVRDAEHPVMKGIPAKWMHAQDELYHGQRGPAKNMRILSTAYSDKSKGGTGVHEPISWHIPYGKGKVFTTVMGHVSGNRIPALQCIGFQTIVARASEWVATGKVTIPVPEKFPGTEAVSLSD